MKPYDTLREKIIKYIQSCHLDDGGYFFARIPPSSGMDTYFAVKSLVMLGEKPDNAEKTELFLKSGIEDGSLNNLTGIFLSSEVLNELDMINNKFINHAFKLVQGMKNEPGGFGAYKDINIETPSELQDTYRAVKILNIIGRDINKPELFEFTCQFLNADGGYGANNYSTLASTYYATEIYKILGFDVKELAVTRDYLRKIEARWQISSIEDLFWLSGALANLNEGVDYAERASDFVLECLRYNGGLARVPIIGIPNLEYTFYGLSILKNTGYL
jgi:hypothetical protein